MGENILLFEFEDVLDLERVLEFEPWSYDKNLVSFQRVEDVESVPYLSYSHATFWVQLHNVLEKSLTCETGELIGKSIGVVVKGADSEDDGAGGEFLRVKVTLNISTPLPRCSKLESEGRQLGWVGIKYESLPNFCYWCGHLTHGERDCEKWLWGKENLRKDDQQYGKWRRADPARYTRKTVAVISGASRTQAPCGGKIRIIGVRRTHNLVTVVQVQTEMNLKRIMILQWMQKTQWVIPRLPSQPHLVVIYRRPIMPRGILFGIRIPVGRWCIILSDWRR